MMRFVKKRITSNRGETIAEVLVASLVIALGMILFVTMVNASFRLLKNEENSYKSFIETKNAFERIAENAEGHAGKVTVSVLQPGGTSTSLKCKDDIEIYSRVSSEMTFYRYEPK